MGVEAASAVSAVHGVKSGRSHDCCAGFNRCRRVARWTQSVHCFQAASTGARPVPVSSDCNLENSAVWYAEHDRDMVITNDLVIRLGGLF